MERISSDNMGYGEYNMTPKTLSRIQQERMEAQSILQTRLMQSVLSKYLIPVMFVIPMKEIPGIMIIQTNISDPLRAEEQLNNNPGTIKKPLYIFRSKELPYDSDISILETTTQVLTRLSKYYLYELNLKKSSLLPEIQ